MFVDEINQNDIASGLTGSAAGRENFNPSAAGDYLTNENYKTLRTNLFFCGADIKVILLTSCRENEGKSTISTELARNLAEADKKTLYIDADMRKSLLQPRNLKQLNHMGLSEFLSGQAEIKDIIYNTRTPILMLFSAADFRLIRLSCSAVKDFPRCSAICGTYTIM